MQNSDSANKNKNQQVDIFSIAFNQRKRINLQKLATFFQDRQNSLIQRRRIYLLIQDTLIKKIQATRETIKQFIRFFEDIITWYEVMSKHMKKAELDKKTKQICQYQLFYTTLCQVQYLNAQQVAEIEGLVSWIEKTVIPALKNAFQGFKDSTKILRKEVQAIFNNADAARFSQTKFYSKIQQNNDLLENQISLIDKIESTNTFTIQWGEKLLQNWKKLLKQQTQVRQLLKLHILDYNRRHCKIYHTNETNNNIEGFWKNLPKEPQVKAIFNSFLEQKQIEFISFGSKKVNFYDKLQQFITMKNQEARVGSMLSLIQILQNKYFKCKIQKDKKQWIETKLYFSLDQHILIFDQEKKKLLLKVNSKGIQGKRVSQNMVQLIGKQTGMIFDSTKKQILHFKTMDQMEQFTFYIENVMEQNNPAQNNSK